MKMNCIRYLFWVYILHASALKKDIDNYYERCVKIEECPSLAHLNKRKQQGWLGKVPCQWQATGGTIFGVSTIPEGEYVCCPNSNKWEKEKNNGTIIMLNRKSAQGINKRSPTYNPDRGNQFRNDLHNPKGNNYEQPNLHAKCEQAGLLPAPESQCCGRDKFFDNDGLLGCTETALSPFPWSVYLKATFKSSDALLVFTCGGSLISRRYVLTAAHCVFRPGEELQDVYITIEEYDRNCKNKMGSHSCTNDFVDVEGVIIHPSFHYEELHHDIALVRLENYVTTRYVSPVCLPTFDVEKLHFSNLPLVVAGWDVDLYGGLFKQSTEVQYVSYHKCHKFYPNLSKLHLCAAGRIGEDTRKGDSGGPLMMYFEENYYIIGIVSGKREINVIGQTMPSLYTNVYIHISWIMRNVRK